MDELQISGKRFISSRRIAKENGYHTDYIGQLIRGGKIKGQKVGRTWYVDELSFAQYLGSESPVVDRPVAVVVEEEIKPVVEIVAEPVVEAEVVEVEPEIKEEKQEEVAEKIIEVEEKNIESAPVVVSVVEEKKEIKEEDAPVVVPIHKVVPVVSGGLKYFVDDEPLLPEIRSSVEVSRATPMSVVEDETTKEELQVTVVKHRPSARRMIAVLATVGVAVFVFSAVVSSTMFQTINIQQGNSASVGYSFKW